MSTTAGVVFLSLAIGTTLWLVLAMIRNEWVYRTRVRWIDQDVYNYERAVDYNTMVWRFWSWKTDVESWIDG